MSARLRLLVVSAVLAVVALSSVQLQALPFNITHVYLSGECGYLAEEVGWWNKDCLGNVTQSGTQSGDWRISTWVNCPDNEENTRYYRWCGGAWVEVSELYFQSECECP